MAVTREEVIWCYEHFLGRLPESEGIVHDWVHASKDIKSMVQLFTTAPEYLDRVGVKQFSDVNLRLYSKTSHGFLFPAVLNDEQFLKQYNLYDYEAEECAAISKAVKPGDTCVDLGARHGYITCVLALAAGSAGKVYAFEPGTGAEVLLNAVAINEFHNVELIRKAAGDHNGEIRFSSIGAHFDAEGGSITVPVVRLDDETAITQRPIGLIKIDIEGAEYLALRGAEKTIKQDRPVIVMEIYDEQQRKVSNKTAYDLVSLLVGWGYTLKTLKGYIFDKTEFERLMSDNAIINVLFIPK